jgi:hypothetical protein
VSIFGDFAASAEAHAKLLGGQNNAEDIKDGELAIAVMDRGWVFVGFITKLSNERIRVDCCHNIHKWGTERGLGQIALDGPTQETLLYPCAPVVGKPLFLIKASDSWL